MNEQKNLDSHSWKKWPSKPPVATIFAHKSLSRPVKYDNLLTAVSHAILSALQRVTSSSLWAHQTLLPLTTSERCLKTIHLLSHHCRVTLHCCGNQVARDCGQPDYMRQRFRGRGARGQHRIHTECFRHQGKNHYGLSQETTRRRNWRPELRRWTHSTDGEWWREEIDC